MQKCMCKINLYPVVSIDRLPFSIIITLSLQGIISSRSSVTLYMELWVRQCECSEPRGGNSELYQGTFQSTFRMRSVYKKIIQKSMQKPPGRNRFYLPVIVMCVPNNSNFRSNQGVYIRQVYDQSKTDRKCKQDSRRTCT